MVITALRIHEPILALWGFLTRNSDRGFWHESRLYASGMNPAYIKMRQDAFGYAIPYPRLIPHSDGAGQVDQVGEGWIDT